MPLSPPVTRHRLHLRAVSYEGHARSDGLFDIEARMTDSKDQDYALMSGVRRPGEPIHAMAIRVTIDRRFNIHAIEAATDAMPYPGGCDAFADAYRRLVGANLVDGFRQTLFDAVGGVRGCTHLNELLAYLPTAAVQTFAGLAREIDGEHKPFQLDRCHALETAGATVRHYYPKWYRGAA